MIQLRSHSEIDAIRKAGRIVAIALDEVRSVVRPGVSTEALDKKAEEVIIRNGGIPAFKGYRGFPGCICTSINEGIVHGIPSSRTLREGDIISIDIGVELGGYFGDAAVTVGVGAISDAASRIIDITRQALFVGIAEARAGKRLYDISAGIQQLVEGEGYSVVRAFVGHGIGSQMHEDPEIPNFGKPGTGAKLEQGMVLAIEPMVNEGTYEIEVLDDGWTAVTKDRKLSAHFEHTITITDGKAEVLTQ